MLSNFAVLSSDNGDDLVNMCALIFCECLTEIGHDLWMGLSLHPFKGQFPPQVTGALLVRHATKLHGHLPCPGKAEQRETGPFDTIV